MSFQPFQLYRYTDKQEKLGELPSLSMALDAAIRLYEKDGGKYVIYEGIQPLAKQVATLGRFKDF